MRPFDPERLAAKLRSLGGGGRCWVAFSGGLDSTVLLHAAAAVRRRLPGVLHAVHVNHGLQPGAGAWAAHCGGVCDTLAVPFRLQRLSLRPISGESLEALAREARYSVLSALLGPDDLLLTAHNQDDQAETLLLALLRGSGVHGLAAMPLVAELGKGRMARPLLDCSRSELEQYARVHGLTWIEDPSNTDTSLDRNLLRRRVLPVLRERWPAVAATLARSAGHCAEAADLVDERVETVLGGLGGQRPGTLSIRGLVPLHAPLQKAVIRLWLRRLGFLPPSAARLDTVLGSVLHARSDANPRVLWAGCEVRRYRDDLFAIPPLPPKPAAGSLHWLGPRLELPCGFGLLERADESVAREQSSDTAYEVRFGATSVTCRAGAAGHRRTLKELFQNQGVPSWLRPYVPLVFDGDRLVAVAGVSTCMQGERSPDPDRYLRWSGHPWEAMGIFR